MYSKLSAADLMYVARVNVWMKLASKKNCRILKQTWSKEHLHLPITNNYNKYQNRQTALIPASEMEIGDDYLF